MISTEPELSRYLNESISGWYIIYSNFLSDFDINFKTKKQCHCVIKSNFFIKRTVKILILIVLTLFFIAFADASSYSCSGSNCNDNLIEAINQYNSAGNYYNSKDYDKALTAYQTASDLGYKSCECDKKVIEIYSIKGLKNSALSYSRSAFNHCGKDAELYKIQGDLLNSMGRYQDALEAYNNALKIDPNNEARYSKQSLLSKYSPTTIPTTSPIIPKPTPIPITTVQSPIIINQRVPSNNDDTSSFYIKNIWDNYAGIVFFIIIIIYVSYKTIKKIRDYFAINLAQINRKLQRANQLFDMENWTHAKNVFQNIIQMLDEIKIETCKNGKTPLGEFENILNHTYYKLGKIALKEKNFLDAFENFKLAKKNNFDITSDSDVIQTLAEGYVNERDSTSEATNIYFEFLKFEKNSNIKNPKILNFLEKICKISENTSYTIINNQMNLNKQVILIQTDTEWAYFNLGLGSFLQNQYQDAINYFNKSINLNPTKSSTYYLLGKSFAQNGQLDSALDPLRTAVKLEPQNHNALFELGRILVDIFEKSV